MSVPATLKQTRKLLSLFGEDPTVEQIQNLLANGDLFQKMLDANLTQVDREAFDEVLNVSLFDRYRTMLVSPFDWLAKLREYNTKYWDGRFTDEDFAQAETQLSAVPDDHDQSVDNLFGFHVQFGSFEETFEMWYKVYQGELPGAYRWDALKFDEKSFRLHELARSYEPGIHLVNIDLVAHWEPEDGRTLVEVREQAKCQSEILAQLEVISFYGVLTELFLEQDGENLPYTDMAGTEVTVPGRDAWRRTLCLRWFRDDRQAKFFAFWVDDRDQGWSAPVLRELAS